MFEVAVLIVFGLSLAAFLRSGRSSAETDLLRARVDALEKTNKELLGLLRKSGAVSQHAAASETAPPLPAAEGTTQAPTGVPPGPAAAAPPVMPESAPAVEGARPQAAPVEPAPAEPAPPSAGIRPFEPATAGGRPLAPLPASLRKAALEAARRYEDEELLPVVTVPPASAAAPPAPPSPGEDAMALEARLGSTWLLRLGLVLLAIAGGLFSVVVTPRLGPAAKVAVGYAGAGALFALGLAFQNKLRGFARPVMAAGLSLAFFFSFAAYFIEPMRCLPMPVSLGLMGVFVLAVLVASDRWRSEFVAGLAIFLGHVSAYVAGRALGSGSVAALVIVVFLSACAVVLLVRRRWIVLSLFAVAAAYASHLLWASLTHDPAPPREALFFNLIFLSSYYLMFAVSDLMWWRGREEAPLGTPVEPPLLGYALGPLNLALYTAFSCFVFLQTEIELERIHYFLFALAGVQGVLALAHRTSGNREFAFYPSAGVVLLTLGFFSAFETLTLNLVLAAEAMVLLITAHLTRMRLFHVLSQAALAANFVHYWMFVPSADPTRGLFIGGMMTVAVYFVKSGLEEIWYGPGSTFGWKELRPRSRVLRELSELFDQAYGLLTPVLAHFHAAAGALMLTDQCRRYLPPFESAEVVAVGAVAFAALGAWRRSVPLLVAAVTAYGGALTLQDFDLRQFEFAASTDFPAHLRAAINASGAAVALLGLLRSGSFGTSTARRLGGLFWPSAALGLFLAAYAASPLEGGREDWTLGLWAAGMILALGALDRFGSAVRAWRDLDAGARVVSAVLESIPGLLIAGALFRLADWRFEGAPLQFVALSGLASVLAPTAALRRSAGVYIAGMALMLILTYRLRTDEAAARELYWVAPASIATFGPLLAAGWVQDFILRNLAVKLGPEQRLAAAFAVGAPYICGLILVTHLFHERVQWPWPAAADGGAALAVMLVTAPFGLRRGAISSILYALFVSLGFVVRHMNDHQTAGLYLAATATLVAAQLGMERAWTLSGVADEKLSVPGQKPDAGAASIGRVVLILGATAVALTAAYTAVQIGPRWTTAAWAIYAALLMGLGFAFKRASYRRPALGVLALCLGRVFLVDIRDLDTIYQASALLVLGLCLVGIAWLYTRFNSQFRRWI